MFHDPPNDDVPMIPKETLEPSKSRRLVLVVVLLASIFAVSFGVSGCTRCAPNVCPAPFSKTTP